MGEGGNKSKTNVTGRSDGPRDPRPKMELQYTEYYELIESLQPFIGRGKRVRGTPDVIKGYTRIKFEVRMVVPNNFLRKWVITEMELERQQRIGGG